jgi:aspartate kinase
MKVFKFGGASTNSYERIKNVSSILKNFEGEKILIVISAIGKITNSLEKVAEAFYEGRKEDSLRLFKKVEDFHLNEIKYLVTFHWKAATEQIEGYLNEVKKLLEIKPDKDYNLYYDQIVSSGELLSSTLISYFLIEDKVQNKWIDVREIITTDSSFREAKIDWEKTTENTNSKLSPLFLETDLVITQGFIGRSTDSFATTLGREGSDFTAAVFGNILNAESVTIWKDVDGIMNADPKDFPNAVNIPELSYKEVIEMAYYGAQVVHPKTIKPLQNKNIPLLAKSFMSDELQGTLITSKQAHNLPPIIVYKKNQALITLQTLDFSFVEGAPVNLLHEILDELKLKPNLTQNTAISLMICVDDVIEKTEQIALKASAVFDVQIRKELTLLTIRHYTSEVIEELTKDKKIILEQKTPQTIQLLMD